MWFSLGWSCGRVGKKVRGAGERPEEPGATAFPGVPSSGQGKDGPWRGSAQRVLSQRKIPPGGGSLQCYSSGPTLSSGVSHCKRCVNAERAVCRTDGEDLTEGRLICAVICPGSGVCAGPAMAPAEQVQRPPSEPRRARARSP